jgi:hypothetical protein
MSGANNGASMIDDLVDRNGEGAILAANHHRKAVADEKRIDAAGVENPGEWKVVRGQHRDWLMPSLHPREIGHSNFVLRSIWIQKIQPLQKNRDCLTGNPA